ncbi:DUF6884 domain-containing protein [Haloarcula marina]|uniref:DUF6884 domain-containing protein n=1 Tax=Haloarcula marina TaxID=2961574 RepID=UPI0020B6DE01|nr:DUF6884 domain-containing protein [Halomicroarcula marina]
MEIGLVSCTKSKLEQAAKPAELYTESAFFRKAREYVEANHGAWYILSAKHHLLHPDGPTIEPYEETLNGASVSRKREWSQTIYEQLQREGLLVEDNRLVLHAGRDYTEKLLPLLTDTGVGIETPTDGLRYGETLAWYNERI